MKDYTVFFKVYGKKLKTTVRAKTPEDAGKEVRNTIEIIKIIQSDQQSKKTDIFDDFDDTMKEFEQTMKEFFDKDNWNSLFGKKKK